MDTIKFLEKLARNVHHRAEIHELISHQSDKIKQAFEANDAQLLKKQISERERFADEVEIMQISDKQDFSNDMTYFVVVQD